MIQIFVGFRSQSLLDLGVLEFFRVKCFLGFFSVQGLGLRVLFCSYGLRFTYFQNLEFRALGFLGVLNCIQGIQGQFQGLQELGFPKFKGLGFLSDLGLGFRVLSQGLGFQIQDLGFQVQDLGYQVQGSRLRFFFLFVFFSVYHI